MPFIHSRVSATMTQQQKETIMPGSIRQVCLPKTENNACGI